MRIIFPLFILLSILISSCKKDGDFYPLPKPVDTVLIIEQGTPFIDDRDGTLYKTVKIGEQTWMAENLRYLPSVSRPRYTSYESPLYYVYGFDDDNLLLAKESNNYKTFGALYNFAAAKETCPDGWHIPTREEWNILIDELGGMDAAGSKLKDTTFKFNALFSGAMMTENKFDVINIKAHWWCDYELTPTTGLDIGISVRHNMVSTCTRSKVYGLAVRCIKD